MKVAIDAMGGDNAPAEIVHGAIEGLQFLDGDDAVVLVGREDVIKTHLAGVDDSLLKRIIIHHAPDVIEMEESPVEALRKKRKSSIAIMAKLAADGEVDAVVSAGNTGACAAACQLKMRTLGKVQRPGIAVALPTFAGPMTVCDVGANVAPKPYHLLQYAQMASAYVESILKIENPRVGLISIGSEEVKGNQIVKQAAKLIRQDTRLNFVGNVEGRDLFSGGCDVAISDGFVGNVVLKLTESLAEGLFKTIHREISVASPELAKQFEPVIQRVWERHDYSEYGGAPLLGVDGVCIICHGGSGRRAIKNAIRVAALFVRSDLNKEMDSRVTEETANA